MKCILLVCDIHFHLHLLLLLFLLLCLLCFLSPLLPAWAYSGFIFNEEVTLPKYSRCLCVGECMCVCVVCILCIAMQHVP